MKFALTVLFIIPLLIPSTSMAQEFREEWFKCQSDDQCVITTGYCDFDWAVNKNLLDQVNKKVSEWQSCLKTGMHNPNDTAKCINNKCEVIYPDNH